MPVLNIARELLAAERERLLRDHYETPIPPEASDTRRECDGCARAYTVRAELAAIDAISEAADADALAVADDPSAPTRAARAASWIAIRFGFSGQRGREGTYR